MKLAPIAAAIVAAAYVQPALAQDAEQLIRDRGCTACHDVSQYRIAPSFKAVSLKFRGNESMALPRFTAALRDGVGHPKSEMSEQEIDRVSRWILSLK